MNKLIFVSLILFATSSCSKSDLTANQPDNQLTQQEFDKLSSVFSPELISFYMTLKDTAAERQAAALKNFAAANRAPKREEKLMLNSEDHGTLLLDPTEEQYLDIVYHDPSDPHLTLGVIQYDIIKNQYERTAEWEVGYNPFGFWKLMSAENLIAKYRPTYPVGSRYNVTEAFHSGSYLQGLTMNVINYSENSHYFTISPGLSVISVVHGTVSTILYTRPVHAGLIMLNSVTFPG